MTITPSIEFRIDVGDGDDRAEFCADVRNGLGADLAAEDELRTEIRAKFRIDGAVAELADAGLETIEWWTDDDADYGMSMSALR